MIIPSTAAPAANSPLSQPIRAGAFWPEIDPAHARAVMRLDGTVTDERLRHELVVAIASVNSELTAWRQRQQAAGVQRLADVPGEDIDDEPVNLTHWRRAIYATAAAALNERYRSFDSTAEGRRRAEELDLAADDLRRDARWAISDIQSKDRATVDLI